MAWVLYCAESSESAYLLVLTRATNRPFTVLGPQTLHISRRPWPSQTFPHPPSRIPTRYQTILEGGWDISPVIGHPRIFIKSSLRYIMFLPYNFINLWLGYHPLNHSDFHDYTYIHSFIWDVITNPCRNFNGGLTKPPLKLGHGSVITHCFTWMKLRIHVMIAMQI